MKLRDLTNKEICDENELPYTIISNIVEEKSAKDRMRATANLIAKALIGTLGPYGTSTIIQDRELRHFATKDGYDLMNRMSFQDEVSRTILELLRLTASNQVLMVGDGSTSAIVVANALIIQKSIKFNDELIGVELENRTSDGRELKYELDSPKDTESTFSDYLQEYVPEEEVEVELPEDN